MSARYVLPPTTTITPSMSSGWGGAVIRPHMTGSPVGVPRIFRIFQGVEAEVAQFSKGEWRFNGPAEFVRVDYSGVTGGVLVDTTVWRSAEPVDMIPDGAFSGSRGAITQGYNEANVKLGRQSYARIAWPLADPVAAGTPRKVHFRTGALPVIFKGRVFDYVSEEMTIELYEGATGITGGTVVPVRNFNRVSPVASLVTITKNVTATDNGTLIDDAEYFFGSANAPQRNPGSIPSGRERILKPNTSYLIVVSGAGRAQYFGDWYEGAPDFPLTL